MTTDELLRRTELAKMFVRDALEALMPIMEEQSATYVKDASEQLIKLVRSIRDLRSVNEDLGKVLGSVNDDS
jgi:hypothetical protein